MTGPVAPKQIDALTGIRGLAALGVVLYHVRLSLQEIVPASVIAVLGKGYLAVDLFFMLSGFVIWHNYAERIAQGGWAASGTFLWRRFARVWPLHAAILGAFLGFALLLEASGRDASGYPFAELPLHLMLFQNWGFSDVLTWNHPAWSISTELAAYLAFPALVMVVRWQRVPTTALLAFAAAIAAALYGLFRLTDQASLGGDIPHLGLWRCLAEFAMGCLACLVWSRWRDRTAASLVCCLACAAMLAGASATAAAETAFVPAVLFAGLLALALGKGLAQQALGHPVMRYLGEISYSVYLVHYLLFIVFKIAFVDNSMHLGWVGLAGYLALVLATSAVLFHKLERPAQRWLNARQPRWPSPAVNAAAE
ncbi:peptidoglycan/LPS O-acetylase OafA/YrhL [Novosphingobium kunmingense]|uniref:Peptidoglycan/LPS O-acetylase OafA/YrhL n=1 Tax=Novosphingobium kunmingense TaxID=1211806 RepID=A0A2N0H7H8_9SPHN|nr:acyltransferase [Novosphingobium kunmingense]PKB14898.1 peptidoglycan/LPS O-acetylase OafA/YrhL [Novosphingobium kunmingense]